MMGTMKVWTALRASWPVCVMLACVATIGVAQEAPQATPGVSLRQPGPTLESSAATAVRFNVSPLPAPVPIMPRYRAFQRDFASDFGYGGPDPLTRDEMMSEVKDRLFARWGEAAWFQWLQRGLAMYARFQASTRFEGDGFDMKVEMDDVPQGKVGLKMSHALE